ncbi:hypothetical protein QAD02_011403 [Eretmocerus hayati]|uniref:Uncharacterized protein n=1 Tax=Eretmocerus hayati TaxID=131215 RepID=A0ACC2NWX7_9HYME|nr:hypothetical protein QAD02_011403 [Eretmocerus hayati]
MYPSLSEDPPSPPGRFCRSPRVAATRDLMADVEISLHSGLVGCPDLRPGGGLSNSITQDTKVIENIIKEESHNNKIVFSDDNNDDIQLGYSGYLRSKSSMLSHPRGKSNFTNDISSTKNNTALKSSEAKGHPRYKRAVTHLYNMILCATGCNPLAYKGYGCYCGFLGSGYPMDGIDRCCKMHDWCYDATECPMFVEYFVPYYWKCYRGYKPLCAIEHGEWGNSGSCAQRLCECDRTFAECLRRYHCPDHKALCTSAPWRLIQNIFMLA